MTLTREEILAMEPGQELDELICNHIFDLEMVAHVHYSSDISAAWEVVTHLKSKHWYFMLSDENEGWEASFYWDPHRPAFEALSSVAPEAICKAALLAALKL